MVQQLDTSDYKVRYTGNRFIKGDIYLKDFISFANNVPYKKTSDARSSRSYVKDQTVSINKDKPFFLDAISAEDVLEKCEGGLRGISENSSNIAYVLRELGIPRLFSMRRKENKRREKA